METVTRHKYTELTGRFDECRHIQMMIESGDLKSLDDVLSTVKSRNDFIKKSLGPNPKHCGTILSIQESLDRGYGKS